MQSASSPHTVSQGEFNYSAMDRWLNETAWDGPWNHAASPIDASSDSKRKEHEGRAQDEGVGDGAINGTSDLLIINSLTR